MLYCAVITYYIVLPRSFGGGARRAGGMDARAPTPAAGMAMMEEGSPPRRDLWVALLV